MTRKDYEKIAAAIAQIPNEMDRAKIATVFAEVAKKDNPAFNEGKFAGACDIDGLLKQ